MMSSKSAFGFIAMAALCLPSEAGLLDHFKKKESCDTTGSSIDHRPAIVRPCYEIVRTYQRGFAQAPGRCDACVPGTQCDHTPQQFAWPSPPEGCDFTQLSGCHSGCDSLLAELIIESQTACHAHHRRTAVLKMGRRFCCKSHKQLMPALVYALNDADEKVRATAADQIGDQLRANPCCCAPYITSALQLSLADCDGSVRTQAEQALIACGYRVVNKSSCPTDSGQCHPAVVTSNVSTDIPAQPQQATPVPAVNPQPTVSPASAPAAEASRLKEPAAVPAATAAPVPTTHVTAELKRMEPRFLAPVDGGIANPEAFISPQTVRTSTSASVR